MSARPPADAPKSSSGTAPDAPLQPAALWEPAGESQVHCRLCRQNCVLSSGQRGVCGVRQNQDGALYTLVANRVAAMNLDPIEKKPLYHFLPGST